MEITLMYVPVGSLVEATRLGDLAVEEQLAACTNVFPIDSTFPWKGNTMHEHEFVLLLKTLPSRKELLRAWIKANHSYEVPCIISWEAEVNEEYGLWMKDCLGIPH